MKNMKQESRIRWAAWITSIAAGVVLAVAQPATAAVVYSTGFETDAVGSLPSGWFQSGNNFNFVTNVEAYAGNNSLNFTAYNGSLGYTLAEVAPIGAVDFYAKFNQAEIDNGWTLRMFDGANGTGGGGYVASLSPGSPNWFGSVNYGAGAFDSGAPATVGAYNHVRIEWDYTGTTDFVRWIWNDAVTNFSSMAGDLAGFRSIRFDQGGADPGGANLFLDNVTFELPVPEPSMLLLGLVAAATVSLFRRVRS